MARQIDNLTHFRRSLAMSVQDFAAAVGVHPSTVIGWSKGRNRPQIRHLKKLSKVLKKPVAEVNAMFTN